MKRLLAALVLAPLPLLAQQAPYPAPQNMQVNDFAQLLTPGELDALRSEIAQYWQDPGVQLTLVTQDDLARIAPGRSPEHYATGLFNAWGIGDRDRDDGVMILLLPANRQVRIELGAGYGTDWNRTAARIIDQEMAPQFQREAWSAGLSAGAAAVVSQIVRPARNEAPPGRNWAGLLPLGIFATVALVLVGRKAGLGTRLRRCPQCGARQLRRSRIEQLRPTRKTPGHGHWKTSCAACGYAVMTPYTAAAIGARDHSGGGFGGGGSTGGGASGSY